MGLVENLLNHNTRSGWLAVTFKWKQKEYEQEAGFKVQAKKYTYSTTI